MKVSIIGTGYVGLVTGACLADWGNQVVCVDIDHRKIDGLNQGEMSIYEPELKELVHKNVEARHLSFSIDMESALRNADVVINAVGTPLNNENKVDLSAVLAVAGAFGAHRGNYALFVNKSTIPMGGSEQLKEIILKSCVQQKNAPPNMEEFFDVVSNPEFLREGSAVQDFMNPDRVVIGATSERATKIMRELYAPLAKKGVPFVITSCTNAEAIKYASNAFLATKISFINEMAELCEIYGADVEEVARGMGLDPRIAPDFLRAGIGYGGSCLPKDVQHLIVAGQERGKSMSLLQAVHSVNQTRASRFIAHICDIYPELDGTTLAVWGVTFKAETDDTREAIAFKIIPMLIEQGASVRIFDPQGMEKAHEQLEEKVQYALDPYEALEGADALLILTEWDVFRSADLGRIKDGLKNPVVIDGRNLYDLNEMKCKGFIYKSMGRTL